MDGMKKKRERKTWKEKSDSLNPLWAYNLLTHEKWLFIAISINVFDTQLNESWGRKLNYPVQFLIFLVKGYVPSFTVTEKYVNVCSYLLTVCISNIIKFGKSNHLICFHDLKCCLGEFLGKVPRVSHLPLDSPGLLHAPACRALI